ncbi:hypothetical protein R3W88_004149 [Solanum pinnatisectum]|uniref:Uncharacterized protein n=1 Tax=Solanum pinnatisectum TaxID=50273 RepID=A0AAV9K8G2_9SOLN|nr:hypothetical protein R3W88_004149 [Solanum pinnatisectum]
MASGATCVQRLDGSRDSAIHTNRLCLKSSTHPPARSANGARGEGPSISVFLGAFRAGVRWSPKRARLRAPLWGREGGARRARAAPKCLKRVRGSFCCAGFDNDPSAGSPTETLLRLLLPLNDKVQWTSRDVAGSEPPTSPRSEHFTGSFNR